jgi:hypothetical protein
VNMKRLKVKVLNWGLADLSFGTFLMALALLTGGCPHTHHHESAAAATGEEFLPGPPAFR